VLQHVAVPPVQRVMYTTPMYAPMYGQPAAQPVVVMPQGSVSPVYYGGYPPGTYLRIVEMSVWCEILLSTTCIFLAIMY